MVNIKASNERWDIVVSLLQDLFNANEVIPFDFPYSNLEDGKGKDIKNSQKYLQHKDNCSRGKRIIQEIKINLDSLLSDLGGDAAAANAANANANAGANAATAAAINTSTKSELDSFPAVTDDNKQVRDLENSGNGSNSSSSSSIPVAQTRSGTAISNDTTTTTRHTTQTAQSLVEPHGGRRGRSGDYRVGKLGRGTRSSDMTDVVAANIVAAHDDDDNNNNNNNNNNSIATKGGEVLAEDIEVSGNKRKRGNPKYTENNLVATQVPDTIPLEKLQSTDTVDIVDTDLNKTVSPSLPNIQSSESSKTPPKSTSSKTTQHGKSFYSSGFNPNEPVLLGSQIAYKPWKKTSGITDWFQCEVTKILNPEGTRFEIKDPEPDDFGNSGASYKCNWKEIILIPPHPNIATARKLKPYPAKTKVLAKYPETTTFYPAEVIGKRLNKNGLPTCVLRFEGEEEVDKETEVERFWVLPFPKK